MCDYPQEDELFDVKEAMLTRADYANIQRVVQFELEQSRLRAHENGPVPDRRPIILVIFAQLLITLVVLFALYILAVKLGWNLT